MMSLAHSSIRFSIGRFTTEADVDYTIELLKTKVGKLRELSPLWDMFKDGIDISQKYNGQRIKLEPIIEPV